MIAGFWNAVVFSLVFFAVFSLRESLRPESLTSQARIIHGLIAFGFIVAAWLVSRL
jgi:hypothetical protein